MALGKRKNNDPFINSLAEEAAKNMILNESVATQNLTDPMYGLVRNKPIYTFLPEGSREYLSKLRTLDGESIEWKRRGSVFLEEINGPVDIYDGFLPSGKLYRTLYVNMYCAYNSTTIPAGFTSVDPGAKRASDLDVFAILETDNTPDSKREQHKESQKANSKTAGSQKTSPEEESPSEMLKQQVKNKLSVENKHIKDPLYGLEPDKPIFTQSAEGTKTYLLGLETVLGESLRWKLRESIEVEGVVGSVKAYDAYLPSGKIYKSVYINQKGNRNSTTIPQGFLLKQRKSKTPSTGTRKETNTVANQGNNKPVSNEEQKPEPIKNETDSAPVTKSRTAVKLWLKIITISIAVLIILSGSLYAYQISKGGYDIEIKPNAESALTSFQMGTKITAKIRTICPAIGVYDEDSTTYSYYACRCITSDGKELWACVPEEIYRRQITNKVTVFVDDQYEAKTFFCVPEKTIRGDIVTADSLQNDLSSDIGEKKIVLVDAMR